MEYDTGNVEYDTGVRMQAQWIRGGVGMCRSTGAEEQMARACIPTLRTLQQENYRFEVSRGYIVRYRDLGAL